MSSPFRITLQALFKTSGACSTICLVLSHLLKSIRIFDILKEIVVGNNAESRSKINEVFQES